nr:glycosyltransferase [Cytophagales bacterium]
MRFLFVIQGEGRGHMTQAMALYQLLSLRGHEVCDVVIGTSDRREIPSFFHKQIPCPIHRIQSPNFVTDSKQKSIRIGATISKNLQKLPVFYESLMQLKSLVEGRRPDVIVNFYDFLAGLFNGIFRPNLHFTTIGHQYLIAHPDFPFASGAPISKLLFQLATRLTAWGAQEQIALSFRPYAEEKTPESIRIWPPILREKIKQYPAKEGDFLLTYLVNPGYSEEVIAWAETNPDTNLTVFWDKKNQSSPFSPLPNVCFYPLDETLFLEKMATCRGLATTAGFESVCEAMYFGKPVMMVPVAGQYEQACNAEDAVISGAGMRSNRFDFTSFLGYLGEIEDKYELRTFADWVNEQDALVDTWLASLEKVVAAENLTLQYTSGKK